MAMFERFYSARLADLAVPGKVLVIYGPRRVGKTFMVDGFVRSFQGRVWSGVGEDRGVREVLESESVDRIRSLFSGYDLVVIDEAQKIRDVGTGLKLLVDHVPGARVVATGSSSFDLAGQIGEPLTGRRNTIVLYPISVLEMARQFGAMRVSEMLETLLVYGSYPETLDAANDGARASYLAELTDSYLLRDILEFDRVRGSRKIGEILTLLAFQIGQEVSLGEIGSSLSMGKGTVARYLDLLEKSFVVRNVRGFSRNLRSEVTRTSRYYFLDNGVRNAVIRNFNPLSLRDDVGKLWENFLCAERLKRQKYLGPPTSDYFWRTYDRKEIDHVEEREGHIHAYEFKWSPRKKDGPPRAWREAYPDASFATITRENFLDFLT